jgi:hypothetical protein
VRARPKPRPLEPRELGIVVAIGALEDLAFWTRRDFSPGGLGFALLFALAPVLVFLGTPRWRVSGRLAVIGGLLALVIARAAVLPTDGTPYVGVGLVVALGLALRRRRLFVPDVALAALAVVTKVPARTVAAFAGVRRWLTRTRVGNLSILPIVIPAGLVGVFAVVLSLANPLLASAFAIAWGAFTNVVAVPSVGRMVFLVAALVVGLALVRPVFRLDRGTEDATPVGEASTMSLQVARNALLALNALFLVQTALDAGYIVSGSPPRGLDTQHYAHAGAFWLTIALVLLTTVIGIMFRGALAHDERAKSIRWLAWGWMAQGLAMAAGTYRRIEMHVEWSGLSDLRIVGILGTTLVVCGVILVGIKLRRQKTFTWLVRRQLDAFAITLVLYSVTPTHLLSAKVNVARIASGEYRPVLHTFRQAHETESAATLIPLLEHSDRRVREGVAALLAEKREYLLDETNRRPSYHQRDLATRQVLAALDAARPRIDEILGQTDRDRARQVLLEIERAANNGSSLEELLAIPAASDVRGGDRGAAAGY